MEKTISGNYIQMIFFLAQSKTKGLFLSSI